MRFLRASVVAGGIASLAAACGDPLDVQLVVVDVTGDVVVSPTDPGVFRITASNPGGERVVWGMGSSSCQFSFFVILPSNERKLAGNRICTDDLVEQGLDPGETRTEEITWGGRVTMNNSLEPLAPGTYQVVAEVGDKGSGSVEAMVQAPAASPDEALQAARARWAAGGPDSYTLNLTRACECIPEVIGPVVIVVRDGQVESREYALGGDPVDPMYADLFPDIEGLFDLIEEALEQGAAEVDATYQSALGYPLEVYIDYHAGTADDEIYYYVREFESL